jgi:hypothetical protein
VSAKRMFSSTPQRQCTSTIAHTVHFLRHMPCFVSPALEAGTALALYLSHAVQEFLQEGKVPHLGSCCGLGSYGALPEGLVHLHPDNQEASDT